MEKTKCFAKVIIRTCLNLPFYMLALFVLKISISLIPLYQIIITASILDEVTLIYNQGTSLHKVYTLIFAMFSLIAVQWGMEGVFSLFVVKIKNLIEKKEDSKIIRKVNVLPYFQLERSETQNIINRIKEKSAINILYAVLRIGDVIKLLIRISGIFFLLYSASRGSAFVVLLGTIPMLYFAARSGKAQYALEMKITEKQRYIDYVSDILLARETACEKNLYAYEDYLNNKWKEVSLLIIKEKNWKRLLWFLKTKGSAMIILLSIVIVGVSLLDPLFLGQISAGFYISIMAALIELVALMTMDFSNVFDELSQYSSFFEEYVEFYSMEEASRSHNIGKHISCIKAIEFKNVSFSYPGQSGLILKNLSFKMDRGKSYALVGRNGAGKTTIVKLLLQLYDSYEGEICINGINIRDINTQELLKKYSVVFQDFCRFPITLRENIMLSEDALLPENLIKDDELGIRQIALKLESGFETEMGKIQSEGDVSGGEWQKIAIARAIVRNADVQILDEPTASLDPVYESRLYRIFRNILKEKDKLSLVITHRLGASKESDCILVLEDGEIVEMGDYQDLMEKRGTYYEMYETQSKWYKN